jgi:hypothetical protein
MLNESDISILKSAIPSSYRYILINSLDSLVAAYPWLTLLCKDQVTLSKLRDHIKTSYHIDIPATFSSEQSNQLITAFCNKLLSRPTAINSSVSFIFRLPTVQSEFLIHSRLINQKITAFNAIIEAYHQQSDDFLDDTKLNTTFRDLLTVIKDHGPFCMPDSVWQLLSTVSSWAMRYSSESNWFCQYPYLLFSPSTLPPVCHSRAGGDLSGMDSRLRGNDIMLVESKSENKQTKISPFIANFDYNINTAGRIANSTQYVLLNAFGQKPGGHVDGLSKHPISFLTLRQLQDILKRQIANSLGFIPATDFYDWIQKSLSLLGVQFTAENKDNPYADILINPFLSRSVNSLNVDAIYHVLIEQQGYFPKEALPQTTADIKVVASILLRLLQPLHFNPGKALGIGANWDGTVSMANESTAYAFKFTTEESAWSQRYETLSLHRQGPSEAYMNAAIGVKFEAAALATSFDYMTQLQPSEQEEVVYSALVDNLITDLFPEPAYFENADYIKHRKQHVVVRDDAGVRIESFYQPNSMGTYCASKKEGFKQTPLFRQAGTLEVQAFPRDIGSADCSRSCAAENPLWPLQVQFAQAQQGRLRGHVVYDPLCQDQFLPDTFYGQVIRYDNGDIEPIIGVMPKNFDKHLQLPTELCASFVVRMMHSARMMTHCPTFYENYLRIKTKFLPDAAQIAPLPAGMTESVLVTKHALLIAALQQADRDVLRCEHLFISLFKNIVYRIAHYGKADDHARIYFSHVLLGGDALVVNGRAACERVIRELTINKPRVFERAEQAKQVECLFDYLPRLVASFYPAPSEELAKSMAQLCRAATSSLMKLNMITAYFQQLSQQYHANLSRKQTPGMMYAALKHSGPSRSIVADYKRMHQEAFPAGYRDNEGHQLAEPQAVEAVVDFVAKSVGAALQWMHRTNAFAVIYRPFSESIVQGKQSYHRHRKRLAWAITGGVYGFFRGTFVGVGLSATALFNMIYHSLDSVIAMQTPHTALNISAAPLNEAGVQVKLLMSLREFLLKKRIHLASQPQEIEMSELDSIGLYQSLKTDDESKQAEVQPLDSDPILATEVVSLYAMPYLKQTYADQYHADELEVIANQLTYTFPLNAEEIAAISPSLLPDDCAMSLQNQIANHRSCISAEFVHAVYAFLTTPQAFSDLKKTLKKIHEHYKLTDSQMTVLSMLAKYYDDIYLVDDKINFVTWFEFDGELLRRLKKQDEQLRRVQNWFINLFDAEWLRESLFHARCERYIATLSTAKPVTPEMLVELFQNSPFFFQEMLQAVGLQGLDGLHDFSMISDANRQLLKQFYISLQSLTTLDQKSVLAACTPQPPEGDCLMGRSLKDQEHDKLMRFTEREWQHRLLSLEEAMDIVRTLQQAIVSCRQDKTYAAILKTSLCVLEATYRELVSRGIADDDALQQFYFNALSVNKTVTPSNMTAEAKALLNNMINVTMNAATNARLDQVNRLEDEKSVSANPLLTSTCIAHWLEAVKTTPDALQSLLAQQVNQSTSIEHALWRYRCIFQVLEKQHPDQRIHHTGLQRLFRFRFQHEQNTTKSGAIYYDSRTHERQQVATVEALCEGSVTMQYAFMQASKKLR